MTGTSGGAVRRRRSKTAAPLPAREIEVEEHDVDSAPRYRGKPVLGGALAVDQLNVAPALAQHLPEIAGTLPDQQHA
ncbi:hypothetical protein [Methanoculleus chikugoensis]|uniref:hypothetical protein n=1 Tax=Methanoculleus chikugoensis TaxID=118126 RepID=UPI0006D0F107|nr:hypothetical protein [Methanoculleus chikugoensis]